MDKKVIAVIVVAILVVAGAGVAIAMNNNNNGGSGEIQVTDADGKTYSFDKPLDKVVLGYSCSGGPFITLAALLGDDLPNHLVGIDNSLYQYRADVYNAFCNEVDGFRDLKKLGGVGAGFDATYVATLGTEAFITSIHHKESVQSNGVDSTFSKLGIPTIYIDYLSEDLTKTKDSLTLLGKLFGKEERANEIFNYYDSKVTPITSKVSTLLSNGTISRTNIYIEPLQFGATKLGSSNGNDYLLGKIAYLCGGNSICSKNSATLEEAYVTSGASFDAIFLTGSNWNNGEEFLNLGFEGTAAGAKASIDNAFTKRGANWTALEAYQNAKIYSLYMGLSREVWDFAAFGYVAKSLNPTQFADVDPNEDLKVFFEQFMPVEYKGTWFYNYTK